MILVIQQRAFAKIDNKENDTLLKLVSKFLYI